jgi:uncharacterized RDD family membrane protein YckC
MDMTGRPPLATVLKRFAAILLDGILFSLVSIPFSGGVYLIMFGALMGGGDTMSMAGVFLALVGYIGIHAYAAFVLAMWAYGLTPGKHIMGIRVVRIDTGRPVGFWRMALRQVIGQWLSAIVCYLGFLWALFDANRQGWHDKIAKTLVVQTR